jgi:hypothetical protein
MRPGLAFVGLFTVLLLIYFTFRESLGALPISLLQLAIVLAVLASAGWYRYSRHRKGWFFFGDDEAKDSSNDAQ